MEMSERIMDVAMSYFLRYGYAKTRVEEIADDLGISKKTIYNHFGDKDTLFDRTVATYVQANVEEVAAVAGDSSKDLMTRMQATLALSMRKIGGNAGPFFLDLQRRNIALGCSVLAYLQKKAFDIISKLVEEAKAQGLVRSEIPTVNIAYVYLNMLAGISSWDDDDDDRPVSRRDIFRDSVQAVLEGVLTVEGRGRLIESIETGLKDA